MSKKLIIICTTITVICTVVIIGVLYGEKIANLIPADITIEGVDETFSSKDWNVILYNISNSYNELEELESKIKDNPEKIVKTDEEGNVIKGTELIVYWSLDIANVEYDESYVFVSADYIELTYEGNENIDVKKYTVDCSKVEINYDTIFNRVIDIKISLKENGQWSADVRDDNDKALVYSVVE